MKERPILFSAPMVRALLAGTKTQTRRIVKPQPNNDPAIHHPISPYRTPAGDWNWVLSATGMGTGNPFPCPYGRPGDRLWVKETIRLWPDQEADDGTGNVISFYPADGSLTVADAWPWKRKQLNSIHCPRGLSRIDLEITGVRVERLNDISEADALAEGIQQCEGGAMDYLANDYAQGFGPASSFRSLWLSINGADSWAANPWVWVVEFKRIKP